jgi:hypothetical protein
MERQHQEGGRIGYLTEIGIEKRTAFRFLKATEIKGLSLSQG